MINLNEKRLRRSLIQVLRDVRLVPVVLVATIALFALKSLGLILDGGYLLDAVPDDDVEITGAIGVQRPATAPAKPAPAPARQSWAQQMFNYPDVTGSVGAVPAAPKEEAPTKPAAAPAYGGRHAGADRSGPSGVAGGARHPRKPAEAARRARCARPRARHSRGSAARGREA